MAENSWVKESPNSQAATGTKPNVDVANTTAGVQKTSEKPAPTTWSDVLDKSVVVVPDDKYMPVSAFCVPSYYRPLIDGILLSRGQICDRLEKIAWNIYEHYLGVREDVVLVVTMKGAITMFHELSKALRRISHFDNRGENQRPCYVEQYVVCSSYRGTERGSLTIHDDLTRTIEKCKGKHVIIVEDLIDSGATLTGLSDNFKAAMRDPNIMLDTPEGKAAALKDPFDKSQYVLSVRSAVGFAKRTTGLWGGFVPDWVAYSLPDVWIVGFGCDVSNHFRDLNHLAVISELGIEQYKSMPHQN